MSLRKSFRHWFSARRSPIQNKRKPALRSKARPVLEQLEDRVTPTTVAFGLYDTGVDAAGAVLADGTVDPHYSLIKSADITVALPNAYVTNQTSPNPFGSWVADSTTSKWISPLADQTTGNSPGAYAYLTSFTLPATADPSTATLSGNFAADDSLSSLALNGVGTGISGGGFAALTQFTISSGFQSGLNLLGFSLNNTGSSPNPTGLRVDGLTLTDTGILITGTAQDDQLVINATSADSGSYQLTSNGVAGPVVNFSGITKFTFNGLAGKDTMQINNPSGGLFAPSGGIFFNGGGQNGDTLQDLGGSATSGSDTPNSTTPAHSGTITHVGASVTQTINYTGLSPTSDTVSEGTYTVSGTSGADTFSIINLPSGNGTRVSSGANNTFETIDLNNKTEIDVNGVSGVDSYSVNNTSPDSSLKTLVLNGGTTSGDTVNILATPSGVSTNWVAGGSVAATTATVNVGNSGSVQGINGVVNLQGPPEFNAVTVDDSADITGRTVTLSSFNPNNTANVNQAQTWGKIAGLAPADINYTYGETLNLTAKGGSGGNTWNVNSTAGGITARHTIIDGGSGGDIFKISASGLGTNSTNDFVGGSASDSFTVTNSISATGARLNIAGNAPASPTSPGDTLTIPAGSTVTVGNALGSGSVSNGSSAVVSSYTGIETISSSSPYDLVLDMTAAGFKDGNATADQIVAQTDSTGTQLQLLAGNAGASPSLLFAGALSSVRSLSIIGSTDSDQLTIKEVNGHLPTFGNNSPHAHTNTAFTGSAPSPSTVGINFSGGGGTSNSLIFSFTNSHNVTEFADNAATANSGVVAIPAQVNVSYDGLSPVTYHGAGGTLTLSDAANASVSSLTVTDIGGGQTRVTGNGTWETVTLDGYDSLLVQGINSNSHTITQASVSSGTVNGHALTGVTLQGGSGGDTISVDSSPSTITTTLLGGDGTNSFNLDESAGTHNLQNILGPIIVSPAGDSTTATDTLVIDDSGDAAGRTVLVKSTTIDGITGDTTSPAITYDGSGRISNVNITGSNHGNTFNVQSTHTGTNYTINTGSADDTVNVSSDAGAATMHGNLFGILGNLRMNTRGNSTATGDTLNVSDFGAGASETYTLSQANGRTTLNPSDSANIVYDTNGNPGQLEHFNLVGSNHGGNTYNINVTSATISNNITDGDNTGGGNSTFNIQANALQGGATNTFNGNGSSNTFNLNFAADTSVSNTAGTTLSINGGTGSAGARNVVNINATADSAARTLGFAYPAATGGQMNITGLGLPSGSSIQNSAVQEVNFFGGANKNDSATVIGTGTGSVLSVTPTSASTADVFLNGTPEILNPTSNLNNPGENGGGSAPDLFLAGLNQATGLTVNGGGGKAQLVVNAPTEDSGGLAGTSGWGGSGMTEQNNSIAGFLTSTIRAAGSAYDTIGVSDSAVSISNNAVGNLTTVHIGGGFGNPSVIDPALTVNTGDEASVQGNGIADNISATLSNTLHILINGGLPTASNPGPLNGIPRGDQLNLTTPAEADIFSDADSPPHVSVNSITAGTQPVTYTSIERLDVTPGNGIVNLIGDNNIAGNNQNDYFKVRGGPDVLQNPNQTSGVGQFSLQIGGSWHPADGAVGNPDTGASQNNGLSAAIYFHGVTRINVSGGAASGFDTHGNAIPDTADAAGINALDVTPYADNTPRGWGIETYWNQGNAIPDGGIANADLLIFNGVPGVSNAITIAPSAALYGQVYDNNAATNTPIAVVNYSNNTNIIVNGLNGGNQGNTDTLTLLGTDPSTATSGGVNAPSGQDSFKANFAAAGTPGHEMVDVTDAVGGATLYNLQSFSGFNSINVNMLGGSDLFDLVSGRTDGSLTVNVDGGAPTGASSALTADTVEADGTAGGFNSFEVTPGATSDSGSITAQIGGATSPTALNFKHIEIANIQGGGSGATDSLTVDGTAGNDNILVHGTSSGAGQVQVSSGPQILFAGHGDTNSSITLDGKGGTDNFTINQVFNWNIPFIAVIGNGNDTVTLNGTGNGDAYTYTPLSANAGIVSDIDGVSTTSYFLNGVTTLSIDAQTPPGTLSVNVPIGDNYFATPGSQSNSGSIAVTTAGGSSLLPLAYKNIQTVTPSTGAIAVVTAPAGGSIHVDDSGLVTVKDSTGIVVNALDLSKATQLDLNVLAGHVSVTIDQNTNGGTLFSGGIQIIGGNSSTTGNSVTVNATTAGTTTVLDFLLNTLTGIVSGPISLFGIASMVINGAPSAQANSSTFSLLNYGALTNLTQVTLNANDGTNGTDKIAITTTSGPSTVNYTPLSPTTAQMSRNEGGPTINITGFNRTDGDLTLNRGGNVLAVNFVGSASNDSVTVSHLSNGGTHVVDQINGNAAAKWVPLDIGTGGAASIMNTLAVLSGLGDDTATVDDSNGAVALPSGMFCDGGAGHNTLVLTGSQSATSDIYTPGPGTGQGSDTQAIGGSTQAVSFANLAPVIDLVSGPLVVNGTNADNAINYTAGPNSGITNALNPSGLTTGQVSVDSFESIEFANKTSLTINALAGSDTINLNNQTTPAGLTNGITVNGGDPTASDTLIVNGTAGSDSVNISPTSANGASITESGLPTITAATIEHLAYNGQSGSDAVTFTTPAGLTRVTYEPGILADQATISARQLGGGSDLLGLSFTNIGAGGSFTVADAGAARSDDLILDGTAASDQFNVSAASNGSVQILTNPLGSFVTVPINTPGLRSLTLNGQSGDDVFNVPGNNPYPLGIFVDGGDPSSSDVLNFTGNGAGAVTVDLAAQTVTEAGFAAVSITGVEVLNVNAGGAAVTVLGTSGNDSLAYTPTGTSAGTLTAAGLNTTFNFSNITAVAGGFTVDALGGTNSVTVNGTSAADTITVLPSGANTTVQVNALQTVTLVNVDTQALDVAGGLGNDSLSVNATGSTNPVAIPITYDGGADFNGLILRGTATSDTYTPGLQLGAGTNTIVYSGGTETVNFTNLAPIFDFVAGPLVVNGTPADNAINYSVGFNSLANFLSNTPNTTWGQVSIDNYEPIEFINKTTLTINGLAGDDKINLHNPNTPTGLTGITVNGDDPTASDTLIVNGTTGVDTIDFAPTGPDNGSVTVNAGPVINFSTIEQVTISGQGGADALTVTTPANGGNGTEVFFTPGATANSGSFAFRQAAGAGGGVLAPMNFVNIDQTGSLTLNSANSGRTDGLFYNSLNSQDTFEIGLAATHDDITLFNTNGNFEAPTFFASSVNGLAAIGIGANDAFVVQGPLVFNTTLQAGGPGATATVTGDGTSTMVVDQFLDGQIVEITGDGLGTAGGNALFLDGMAVADLADGGSGITIDGTAGPDNFTYTPTGGASGTVTSSAYANIFNLTTTSGGIFTINGNGGSDQLTVNGSEAADTIDVNTAAANTVAVGALQPVSYAGIQNLVVNGLAGNDTFNVTPSATTTISVDGGDPIGLTPGDRLNIFSGGSPVTFSPGPHSDEGGFQVGADQAISFVHIESLSVSASPGGGPGGPVTINGTNGNDTFTVIARDASYDPAADGVQDFTVSVNGSPDFLFLDTPSLNLNGLAGNDNFVVEAPAPNGAVWNVQLNIDGGTPETSANGQGDTLTVEQPAGLSATQTVAYTPTSLNGGLLDLVNLTSLITITNVEKLAYEGVNNNAALSVTTANAVITPGATPGSGEIDPVDASGSPLLTLTYQNVASATVTGGTAVIEGTAGDDVISVSAAGIVTVTNNLGFTNSVDVSAYSKLVIDGLGGDDSISIASSSLFSGGIIVLGGDNGSGSDLVTVAATNPTLDLANNHLTGVVGGPITLMGVEDLTINGTAGVSAFTVNNYGAFTDIQQIAINNGATLSVNGSSNPDAITYTPTASDAGMLALAGLNPGISFTGISGNFTLDPGTGSNTVTVNGTSNTDTINVVRGATTTVQVNSLKTVNIVSSDTQSLIIASGTGGDTINVSGNNGPAGLTALGGQSPASASLNITNTGTGTTTYSVGNTNDSGSISNSDGTVNFAGVRSVKVTAASGTNTLAVNATNGNDAITAQGLNGNNMAWVNAQAPITFSGFGTLTLNGRFGNDTFTVTPSTLSGVTTINVAGTLGANDLLTVNGSSGADAFNYSPTSVGAGSVATTGAGTINFTNLAAVAINGQGGTDALTVTTPAGVDRVTYTPGSTADAGTIETRVAGGGTTLVPLTFNHIGAGGSVTFASSGGREDVLHLFGTNDSDTFSVNGPGDTIQITNGTGGFVTPLLHTGGINLLELSGLNGDDQFNLAGSLPYANGTLVDGGDPSASDVVNLSGATGAVGVNLGNSSVPTNTTVSGNGSLVTLVGVEVANIDAAGNTVTVTATTGPDTVNVTPTGSNSATLQANGVAPVVNLSNTGTLSVNGNGGSDQLVVQGTQGNDSITATGTAVTVNALLPVNYTNFAHLEVDALAGNDVISVTPSANTSILVDGGDPIGITPGDQIILHPTGAFSIEPGPTADSGGMNDAGQQRTSWVHIENVAVIGGSGVGPAVVTGTNGNDAITIIARDSSYNPTAVGTPNPLLDGIQDFTVSVNGGPDILFANTPTLFVDALAGNDDIAVHEPAPNNAAWNTQVYVAGGTPSSSAAGFGDKIEVETPGTQSITYAPNPASIPAVTGVAFPTTSATDTAILSDTTNTSAIIATPFTITGFYQSSPGGVEQFVYQGNGGNDTLTYMTPNTGAAGTVVTYTPGAAADAGTITAQTTGGTALVPLTFSGLGVGTSNGINFTSASTARVDTLSVNGTSAGDTFQVNGSGNGKVQVFASSNSPETLPLTTTSIATLALHGLGSADTFNLVGGLPYTNTILDASDPIANLSGATGLVTVNVADSAASTNTTITGYGGVVTLMGIDTANLNTNNFGLTINGYSGPNTFTYQPTGASAGAVTDAGVPTTFNFTNTAGTFTINGQANVADQVNVQGTNNSDFILVDSPNRTVSVSNAAGTLLKPVVLGAAIEEVQVNGLLGSDTFLVVPAPATATGPGGAATNVPINLLINIVGGPVALSDELIVSNFTPGAAGGNPILTGSTSNLPATDFVVNFVGAIPGTGVIRDYRSLTQLPDITYQNIGTVAPLISSPGGHPNLLNLGPDTNEPNDFQDTSAFLGSASTINVAHGAIFPNVLEHRFAPADQDYYQVVAQTTGTLDFQVYFHLYAGLLPAGGNLNVEVLDANGNQIGLASGGTADFGAIGSTGNARVRIPAVAGQSYFVHVFGTGGNVINGYSMTVINTAPPTPFNLELSRSEIQVTVTNPGAGYTSTPVVTLVGGGGTYKFARAVMGTGPQAGQVVGIVVTEPTGYTSAPMVLITGGGGAGATAVATFYDSGDLPSMAANDDSGRSQFDNVTNINDPVIYLRLSDGILLNDLQGNGTIPTKGVSGNNPPVGVIPIPFSPLSTSPAGFRVAIFDGNDAQNPIGFATPVAGFPGLYQFDFSNGADTVTGAAIHLSDGIHHITAAVEMIDPATPQQTGFGPLSTSLDLTVDTVPPPVQFGGDGFLGLVTDSGVPVEPETAQDLVTNDTTPTFAGLAEANSVVRVYVAITNPKNPNFSPNPVFPNNYLFIGETVAIPLDGTNAFPDGQWQLTSLVDLNNPTFFDPADGERDLIVTAEDLAGNIGSPIGKSQQMLSIFIDTAGPQINGVNISNPLTGVENTNFNLFGLKPDNQNQGPTPLVYSITIDVVDNPPRTLAHLENAIKVPVAEAPGGILVIGDQVGEVAIAQIIATNNPPVPGQPATATVQLIFTAPLPDDRYTLHIFDTSIVDPAGNILDGESNAQEPIGVPTFPSGNGIVGGDFFARFTVNSRPNVGTDGNGIQQLDVNGNGFYDPVNAHDATNSDMSFAFARYTDNLFSGNFAPAGQDGNGFQRLGAYGVINGKYRFLLSFAGIADTQKSIVPTLQINGLPVAYKFNPNVNADEIAVFDGKGNWYIDYAHTNNLTSKSLVIHDNLRGYPVAGDFDGNGSFDLATYQPDTNTWQFDLNPLGPNHAIRTLTWGFPGVMERPVAADMNGDGITDIGIFVPSSMSPIANPGSNWYFLESRPGPADPTVEQAILSGVPTGLALGIQGTINALNHPFSDTPFSQDQYFLFGDGFSQPIVGLWDPPVNPAVNNPVTKTAPGSFADVSVSAELGSVPVGGFTGVFARRNASGTSEYWGGLARTGSSYAAQIRELSNGKWQTLTSVPVSGFNFGEIITLDAIGTTLELDINGHMIASLVDTTNLNAGGVGTYASAGSSIWPAHATAVTRTATLPFSDSLSQISGSLLDTNWNEWTGSFRAQGNSMVAQAATNLATVYGLNASDVSQTVTLAANVPLNGFAGLVSRYNAAGTAMYQAGLAAAYDATRKTTTYSAQIWLVVGTKRTLLVSKPVAVGSGRLTFATVRGSLELFLNNTLVAVAADTTLKSGSIGLNATKGSQFSNFTAAAPALTAATLPFTDSFTSGTVPGASWYSDLGGFGVAAGTLTGLAGANEMTLYGVSQQNASVQAQLTALAANTSAGLLARYNASTGDTLWAGLVSSYDAVHKTTTYSAQIRQRVGGVWRTLLTITTGVHPGLLRFDVSGSQLSLYLDGNLVGKITGTLLSAGSVGLAGDLGSKWTAFSAKGL